MGRMGRRVRGLALVLACLAGCATPVGVTRVSPQTAYEDINGDVLTGGAPSEITRSVLRRRSLLEAYARNPDQALAELHAMAVGDTGGRRELFALAELSFLRGE